MLLQVLQAKQKRKLETGKGEIYSKEELKQTCSLQTSVVSLTFLRNYSSFIFCLGPILGTDRPRDLRFSEQQSRLNSSTFPAVNDSEFTVTRFSGLSNNCGTHMIASGKFLHALVRRLPGSTPRWPQFFKT